MTKKEDELLSIQYQIEKTGVRQQRLEEGYESVTAALKKSKRNNRIVLGLFLVTILIGAALVLGYNNNLLQQFKSKFITGTSNEDKANSISEIDVMQEANDSLQIELAKLKSEITVYKSKIKQQEQQQLINPLENTLPPIVDTNLVNTTIQEKSPTIKKETKKEIVKSKYRKQYCYPVKAFKRDDVGFIEVDYIEFFEGNRAVREARKHNKAEYDFNAKGDTIFFLKTNHFINNKNKKLRILELDDNVRVLGVNQVNNGFSIKSLQSIVARKPILLLETNDGIVYRISEKKI